MFSFFFELIYLFSLEDNYNIVMLFAIHRYEYMCPLRPETSSHLPPHPIPPGWHRAPALSSLHHTAKFPLAIYFTYGPV